jgi:predicted nucleic acid-binding protein
MAYTALFDACVLYSAPVTDLVMRLALVDMFRPKWTARIHAEWMRNLAQNRPDLSAEQIENRRRLMDAHARDAVVEGYESLVPSLELPDPDDRHVLAAAIVGRADAIVTFNLGDFPTHEVERFGIEVQHPDEFLQHQFDLNAAVVCAVVRELRGGLIRPPRSAHEYLAMLERHGLPGIAGKLRVRERDL